MNQPPRTYGEFCDHPSEAVKLTAGLPEVGQKLSCTDRALAMNLIRIALLACVVAVGFAIGFIVNDRIWSHRCVIQNMHIGSGITIDDAGDCLIRNNTIGRNVERGGNSFEGFYIVLPKPGIAI